MLQDYDPDEGSLPRQPRKEKKKKPPRVFKTATQREEEAAERGPLTDKQKAKYARSAMNSCMWHLERSMKTRKELKDKLVLKDIPDEIIETTLDKLEELKLIDDADYSEAYVRSRVEGQNKARSVIKYDLLRKGVDADTVAEALEAISPEAEEENARKLVSRKLYSTRTLERQKRTTRLVGMLARKGYNGSLAYQIVKEAIDNETNEENMAQDISFEESLQKLAEEEKLIVDQDEQPEEQDNDADSFENAFKDNLDTDGDGE